ncbi:hypothetical protein THAOC_10872 [Thalassiosira oceanica]|uniref:Uncharacterized protein n=1 Tax=Thalassiosira oceanica TaxID=159749 RepID=K0TBX1_THAOC|nr:hypothetical protein THAOC_10872 [Thalassiosira oceanica]|eukprot:EJK68002.1 hypothetical protein THAOC_10872 [Thalassiosira oceanica]
MERSTKALFKPQIQNPEAFVDGVWEQGELGERALDEMAARSFISSSFLSSSLSRASAGAGATRLKTTSRSVLCLNTITGRSPPDCRAQVQRWQRRSVGGTPPLTTDSSSAVQPRDDGALTSSDGVVGRPIDFDTSTTVEGRESQIATIRLEPGQVLRAESGAMMYMSQGVNMNTTTGGGLGAGLKRALTGQNLFISDYTYDGSGGPFGIVALGTDFPSKIVRLNLQVYGGKIVCQQGALLCASHTVDIDIEFTKKLSTGFFGGEGFVLQGLTGTGDVMVKAGGTLIRKDLREGEELRISSGCLVGYQDGVEFDIKMLDGYKNVLFGGEGLFVSVLRGPGTVWLQGQPPQRMVSEIARRVPSGGGIGLAVPIPGMGGGGGGESGGDDSPPTSP